MPAPTKSATRKQRGRVATVPAVPAGFEHCWDKLPDEIKVFVQKAQAHGKKFVPGQATTKEVLEFLLSTPAKLRAAFAQTPGGAIFLPENFVSFESFHAALYGPRTPANSQFAATFRLIGYHLKLDLEKTLGQVVAAAFNLHQHCEKGMILREASEKALDDWLRVLGKTGLL